MARREAWASTVRIRWVSYLSQYWREFVKKRGIAMAMERLKNLSDEVTEGLTTVRVEDERVKRGGWIVNC